MIGRTITASLLCLGLAMSASAAEKKAVALDDAALDKVTAGMTVTDSFNMSGFSFFVSATGDVASASITPTANGLSVSMSSCAGPRC